MKKMKKLKEIEDGMKGLEFDMGILGHRDSLVRCTHLLLITLTFSREASREKAWHSITTDGQELNRYKANLTKILGSKATITVKEAQQSGYPAPHILVLLDKPIKTIRHLSKKSGKITWRLSNRGILRRLKSCWKHGWVDVEGAIKNENEKEHSYSSPIRYLWKYLGKSITSPSKKIMLDSRRLDDLSIHKKTALFTHLWNKIFQSRDIYISKAFKDRLNFHQGEAEKASDQWELLSIESISDETNPFRKTENLDRSGETNAVVPPC